MPSSVQNAPYVITDLTTALCSEPDFGGGGTGAASKSSEKEATEAMATSIAKDQRDRGADGGRAILDISQV